MLAVIAMVLGIVGSAFTMHPSPKVTNTEDWFQYVSGPVDDASSYVISSTGDPGCDNTQQLCAIKVMNDGSDLPDQTALDFLYSHNNNLTQPVSDKVEFRSAP